MIKSLFDIIDLRLVNGALFVQIFRHLIHVVCQVLHEPNQFSDLREIQLQQVTVEKISAAFGLKPIVKPELEIVDLPRRQSCRKNSMER